MKIPMAAIEAAMEAWNRAEDREGGRGPIVGSSYVSTVGEMLEAALAVMPTCPETMDPILSGMRRLTCDLYLNHDGLHHDPDGATWGGGTGRPRSVGAVREGVRMMLADRDRVPHPSGSLTRERQVAEAVALEGVLRLIDTGDWRP